ncbi:TlpA family protein disulfide reductase [Pseudoflavitalea sp. G-6-1-2]|nr:TlpA family protein disulfide reductase [Pseudoflavitalea sp. G-6-1-2]
MLCAYGAKAQQPVQVSGQLKKSRSSTVRLFRVSEGAVYEMATSVPGKDGRFGFLFYPPYAGFYAIGTGEETFPDNNYKFYFRGGEKLSLLINDTSYVLAGNRNSKENILMTQWHDYAYVLENKSRFYSSSYKDFFPDLERISNGVNAFLKGKSSGNATFDRLMRDNIAWDLAGYACNFLLTPRPEHPATEQYIAYYKTMQATQFAKQTLHAYRQPWGKRILQQMASVNLRQLNIKYGGWKQSLSDNIKLIPNDTLKGDFVLYTGSMLKSIGDYNAMLTEYGQYLLTDSQQHQSRQLQAPLALFKEGEPALNFNYPDNNGKMVSLASLKGKVVLVDLWATWCGPCKFQIPYLKKLEKEMHGTDLEIVSITIDTEKDKEKWKDMIRQDTLGGIQLFAGVTGDIRSYYKVEGIPRFMLFDRQGRIINVNAPRPSDPALKELLLKALAENK